MNNKSRCRERTEGWLGRKRTYRCISCGMKFQIDTLNPLLPSERLCSACKLTFTFTDKETKQDIKIEASNVELATLRAWNINPNLTFKEEQ